MISRNEIPRPKPEIKESDPVDYIKKLIKNLAIVGDPSGDIGMFLSHYSKKDGRRFHAFYNPKNGKTAFWYKQVYGINREMIVAETEVRFEEGRPPVLKTNFDHPERALTLLEPLDGFRINKKMKGKLKTVIENIESIDVNEDMEWGSPPQLKLIMKGRRHNI